jgi:hypothetical protein
MNDLITQNNSLPANIEDLSKFVLVGREKFNAVRAEIRAIEKIKLAEEVRNQKREEAQMLSAALLDAEVKLGELFKELPKGSGGDRRSEDFKSCSAATFEKPKEDVIKELGFSKFQANRFETLADNQDLVEQVKQEAFENDDFPTRARVIDLAKARREQEQGFYKKMDDGHKMYCSLSKIIESIDDFDTSPQQLNALLESYDENLRLDEQIQEIQDAINTLFVIKKFMERRFAEGERRKKS